MTQTLDAAGDEREIRQLIERYAAAVDAGDGDSAAELFAPSGVFEIWLDPWKYFAAPSNGLGYQPVQGQLAFGRGGLFGTGLGLGHVGAIPIPTSELMEPKSVDPPCSTSRT